MTARGEASSAGDSLRPFLSEDMEDFEKVGFCILSRAVAPVGLPKFRDFEQREHPGLSRAPRVRVFFWLETSFRFQASFPERNSERRAACHRHRFTRFDLD